MSRRSNYPDSVNLVRPPNTTMPKTLAALASSQYATLLSLVSGKLEAFSLTLEASDARTSTLDVNVSAGTVDCHLTSFVIGGCW
jgi:hypothetical protein